jgi:integrase
MRLVQADSKGTWKMDRRVRQEARRLSFPRQRRAASSSDVGPANEPSAEILGCRGGLNPKNYGAESLRRTKALHILNGTGDLETVRLLLGHTKIESTARYLRITKKSDPIAISRAFDI